MKRRTIWQISRDPAHSPPGGSWPTQRPENKGRLTKILTAHVVAGRWTAQDIIREARGNRDRFYHVNAVSGDALSAKVTAGNRMFIFDETGNAFEVTQADVMQSNGVIHVVEGVLLPR